MRRRGHFLGILATLGIAILGGGVAAALHVPAGGIVGSVLAVGTVSILTGRLPELSPRWRRNAQVLTGTVIGSGIGPHLFVTLADFWLAALMMTFWIISVSLALGWIVSKKTGLDLRTALFAFAPGGLAEMTATVQDLGGDARVVAMVGLLRVLLTIVVVPLVIGYLVLQP